MNEVVQRAALLLVLDRDSHLNGDGVDLRYQLQSLIGTQKGRNKERKGKRYMRAELFPIVRTRTPALSRLDDEANRLASILTVDELFDPKMNLG